MAIEEKRPMRIGAGTMVVIVLYAAAAGLSAYIDPTHGGGWAAAVGVVAAGLLIAFLFGWIVWKCMRRPRAAPNIVICFVLLIFSLGAMGGRSVERREAVNQFNEEVYDIAKESAQDLERHLQEGSDDFDGDIERLDHVAGALNQQATLLSGHERAANEVLAGCLSSLQKIFGRYNTAYKEALQTGGISPIGLVSIEVVDHRITCFENLAAVNEQLTNATDDMLDRLTRDLEARGIPESMREEVLAGFSKGFQKDQLLLMRDTDRRLCDGAIQLLNLLKERWGTWSYDEASEAFVFDDDATTDRYNQLFAAIGEAANEQAAIQEKLLADKREYLKSLEP